MLSAHRGWIFRKMTNAPVKKVPIHLQVRNGFAQPVVFALVLYFFALIIFVDIKLYLKIYFKWCLVYYLLALLYEQYVRLKSLVSGE